MKARYLIIPLLIRYLGISYEFIEYYIYSKTLPL